MKENLDKWLKFNKNKTTTFFCLHMWNFIRQPNPRCPNLDRPKTNKSQDQTQKVKISSQPSDLGQLNTLRNPQYISLHLSLSQ